MLNYHVFSNGVVVVNTTPHSLTMQDMGTGELVTVENNTESIINATTKEKAVSNLLVKTEFVGTAEGESIIEEIQKWFSEDFDFKTHTLVIIGSIIAAQAYPGKVLGLTPVPGYERVAPTEKRMRNDKFTTFA